MLAPWKKSYDKTSILKSRDITLPTEVHLVEAMVFPVVIYECAHQASLSMDFSKQEYWSGLPSPGIEPTSALQADSLPLSYWGSQENWQDHLIVQTLIILIIRLPLEWL